MELDAGTDTIKRNLPSWTMSLSPNNRFPASKRPMLSPTKFGSPPPKRQRLEETTEDKEDLDDAEWEDVDIDALTTTTTTTTPTPGIAVDPDPAEQSTSKDENTSDLKSAGYENFATTFSRELPGIYDYKYTTLTTIMEEDEPPSPDRSTFKEDAFAESFDRLSSIDRPARRYKAPRPYKVDNDEEDAKNNNDDNEEEEHEEIDEVAENEKPYASKTVPLHLRHLRPSDSRTPKPKRRYGPVPLPPTRRPEEQRLLGPGKNFKDLYFYNMFCAFKADIMKECKDKDSEDGLGGNVVVRRKGREKLRGGDSDSDGAASPVGDGDGGGGGGGEQDKGGDETVKSGEGERATNADQVELPKTPTKSQ